MIPHWEAQSMVKLVRVSILIPGVVAVRILFFFFFSLSLSLSKLKIASPSCKGPSDALILGVDRCNDVDATMAFGTMS